MKTSRLFVIGTMILAIGALGACRKKDKKRTGSTGTEAPKTKLVKDKATGKTVKKVVKAGEIKIGTWGPQTGPAAPWGIVARGTAAYFDMINAEGGINGYKIKLILEDDQYNPAKTIQVVKKMVERDKVFALVGGLGTATGAAVESYITKKFIPWVGPASGSERWAKPLKKNIFSLYPSYEKEAALMTRHLITKEKKTKIAVIYQSDDYGKEGLKGVKAELAKSKKTLVAEISVNFGEKNLVAHVAKLKKSGADTVMMWLSPLQAIITMGTAAKMGFKTQWATSSTCSDAFLLHAKSKGLWDNVLFPLFVEAPDSDHKLIQKYKKVFAKYGKARNSKDMFGVFFVAGAYFAESAVEAMKKCKKITRECFLAELEKINNWNGGVGHNISFSPTNHQGGTWWYIAKAVKGKTVKQTPWIQFK